MVYMYHILMTYVSGRSKEVTALRISGNFFYTYQGQPTNKLVAILSYRRSDEKVGHNKPSRKGPPYALAFSTYLNHHEDYIGIAFS